MKKHLKKIVVLTAMMLFFCPAAVSIASLITEHTHQVCSRDGGYILEKQYTHSHYCTKNGITDWWPCIVYDKYKRTERYCADCKMVIESLCYTDYEGQVHELAY